MNLKRKLLIAAAGGSVAAVAVALATWFFVFRSDAPPPVSLSTALAAIEETAGTPQSIEVIEAPATAQTAEAVTAPVEQTPAAAETQSNQSTYAGTWTLVQGANSFVGYRVDETLAGVGATTAVGRTQSVEGSLVYDGNAITSVQVTADVTALASDKSMRDNALRQQALETASYPTASFSLTTPIAISTLPGEGETVSRTVAGDLTLHGVTRSVELAVEGVIKNGQLVIVGSTEIEFADFAINSPRSALVLSVADHGTLELQLMFVKSA